VLELRHALPLTPAQNARTVTRAPSRESGFGPQDILAATVHAVRAALGGLKGGAKPPMASPTERATAIRSTDYLTRDARWPDPR
jgi:hypothetical protein